MPKIVAGLIYLMTSFLADRITADQFAAGYLRAWKILCNNPEFNLDSIEAEILGYIMVEAEAYYQEDNPAQLRAVVKEAFTRLIDIFSRPSV